MDRSANCDGSTGLVVNTRPPRTDEDLRNAAGNIYYEVEMLCNVLALWLFLPLLNPAFRNMAIESFLVHFRNVRDFLYPTHGQRQPDSKSPDRYAVALDSVLAFDFNPSGWNFEITDWIEVAPDERNRINRMLSHVSYSRSSYAKEWPLQRMGEELTSRFIQFLKTLTPGRKDLFAQFRFLLPQAFQ